MTSKLQCLSKLSNHVTFHWCWKRAKAKQQQWKPFRHCSCTEKIIVFSLYSLCCSIHKSIHSLLKWNEVIEIMNILTSSSDTDSDLNYTLQFNSDKLRLPDFWRATLSLQKSEVLCFLVLYTELLGWNEFCRGMPHCIWILDGKNGHSLSFRMI